MMLDLAPLFEARARVSKYPGTRDELEAVAAGAKAMAVSLFPSAAIDTHPFYGELREIASELNLSIVINDKVDVDQDPNLATTYIFVTKSTEYWRIPAYLAFKRVFEQYGWSDSAEHFESLLLGYTDDDITTWLNAHSASRIGWSGVTFNLLLSDLQASNVRKLGKRSIDPSVVEQPIQIFFNRKHHIVRKDADKLLVGECALARVSVCEPFFRELFGRQIILNSSDVVTSLLTPTVVTDLNLALESNFQFFEEGTWK